MSRAKELVVAVDLGSTHTSYSYAFTSSPNVIVKGKKQPTCALFDKKGVLLRYGDDARDWFLKVLAGDQLLNQFSQWSEQSHFIDEYMYSEGDLKMKLFADSQTGLADDVECDTLGGLRSSSLLDIVSKILRHIKARISREIGETMRKESMGDVAAAEEARSPKKSDIGRRKKHARSTSSASTRAKSSSASLVDLEGLRITAGSPASGYNLDDDNVFWVLTVPAIWSEVAKNFMRRAAHKAGWVPEPSSRDLVLALEPECAAIAADGRDLTLSARDKVLTLDCGGGTVDICCTEVVGRTADSLVLRQVLVPTGGNWGSKYVDANFLDFIKRVLGSDVFDRINAVNPGATIEMLKAWERAKCSMTSADFAKPYEYKALEIPLVVLESQCKLPATLKRFYKTLDKKDVALTKGFKCRAKTMPFQDSTILLVPHGLIRSFFEPVLSPIVAKVRELFSDDGNDVGEDVHTILLVGGLSRCDMLYDEFKKAFPTKRVVRSAEECETKGDANVDFGAVKFGLQPGIVSSRRAALTIGLRATVPYDSTVHTEEAYQVRKNRIYDRHLKKQFVRNVFTPFVCKGDEIDSASEVVYAFGPRSKDQSNVKFDVYVCEDGPTNTTTDEACHKMARLDVAVTPGQMPKLECAMHFGMTEVTAVVRNLTAKTEERVLLQFQVMDKEDDEKEGDGVGENAKLDGDGPVTKVSATNL